MAPTANASCSPGMSLRPIPGGSARPWCSHSRPNCPRTPTLPHSRYPHTPLRFAFTNLLNLLIQAGLPCSAKLP